MYKLTGLSKSACYRRLSNAVSIDCGSGSTPLQTQSGKSVDTRDGTNHERDFQESWGDDKDSQKSRRCKRNIRGSRRDESRDFEGSRRDERDFERSRRDEGDCQESRRDERDFQGGRRRYERDIRAKRTDESRDFEISQRNDRDFQGIHSDGREQQQSQRKERDFQGYPSDERQYQGNRIDEWNCRDVQTDQAEFQAAQSHLKNCHGICSVPSDSCNIPIDLSLCEVDKSSNHFDTTCVVQSLKRVPTTNIGASIQPPNLQEDLRQWALNCNVPHTHIKKLLHVLKIHHPTLPKDPRTLLQTDALNCPVLPMGLGGKGKYIHFGLKTGLSKFCAKLSTSTVQRLPLSFNIDGASPYKNSKGQLWSILCQIKADRLNYICIVGVYWGRKKPGVEEYLSHIVDELGDLLKNGITYMGQQYQVYVHSFRGDAPATAYIKCTKGHNGFYGCPKCDTKGISVERNRVFPETGENRTDKSFRKFKQEDHHVGSSPLLSLPLDMIHHFPLEPMHQVYLGVVKRLCFFWKNGAPTYSVKEVTITGKQPKMIYQKKGKIRFLSKTQISAIDTCLELLIKSLPDEVFARKVGPFSDSDSWKAVECREFLLYLAPIVLKNFLEKDVYEHYLLLFVAIRILVSQQLISNMIDLAESLITLFVAQCKDIYGPSFTVFNVHCLIHLTEDVRKYGPLESFSAFPFENCQGIITSLLRGHSKPLEQLWKRVSERDAYLINADLPHRQANLIPLSQSKHKFGPTCGLTGDHFSAIIHPVGKLSLKQNSNIVCLNDASVVSINNFILQQGSMFIIGQIFKKKI